MITINNILFNNQQLTINCIGGGLADWYPTYLLRYTGATVDGAGLLVGAATVLGGIGGSIIGR